MDIDSDSDNDDAMGDMNAMDDMDVDVSDLQLINALNDVANDINNARQNMQRHICNDLSVRLANIIKLINVPRRQLYRQMGIVNIVNDNDMHMHILRAVDDIVNAIENVPISRIEAYQHITYAQQRLEGVCDYLN